MDMLRWSLLGIGILIVIGVYVWSRRREQADEDMFVRTEPGVGHDDDDNDPLFAPTSRGNVIPPLTTDAGEPDLIAVHRELSSLQDLLKHESRAQADAAAHFTVEDESIPALLRAGEGGTAPLVPEDKLVVLYLVAHSNQLFTASAISESLRELELDYDAEMHIYHRYADGSDSDLPVFGVANLVEPGTLVPEALATTGTPGLTLFLQMPGPLKPVQAFDLFINSAQRLAKHLDGELRDKNRNALSRQMLEHLRDDIQQYERRLHLAAHV